MCSHDTNTEGTKKQEQQQKKTPTVFDTPGMRMKCGDKKWRKAREVVLKWVLVFWVHFVCTYTFYEKDKVKQRAEDNRETSLSINEWRLSHYAEMKQVVDRIAMGGFRMAVICVCPYGSVLCFSQNTLVGSTWLCENPHKCSVWMHWYLDRILVKSWLKKLDQIFSG